jgi:FAD/FMN-containing dehydrogenase
VTSGSGIVLWTLRTILNAIEYTLPVVNDGYPGPTVGGFVAAGGFGSGSARYGGFWENVSKVTLVTGRGTIEHVGKDHPLFPWLFGAMGQLGIVADATLDIVAIRDDASPSYPHGLSVPPDLLRKAQALQHPVTPPTEQGNRLYWSTLFVSEAQRDEAAAELRALEEKYAKSLSYRERYQYFLLHRKITAPLLYPKEASFFATGSWSHYENMTLDRISQMRSFEADFMDLAMSRKYRRYIQSEIPSDHEIYAQCFGPDILTSFREVKHSYDPRSIINRGSVFPVD